MRNKALKYFRGVEGYNCAQAVLKACQESHGQVDEEKVRAFMMCGGGLAEGGKCGALYAALSIQNSQEKKTEIENRFSEIAGSTKCREIRKLRKVSCRGCVEAASGILEETLQV